MAENPNFDVEAIVSSRLEDLRLETAEEVAQLVEWASWWCKRAHLYEDKVLDNIIQSVRLEQDKRKRIKEDE